MADLQELRQRIQARMPRGGNWFTVEARDDKATIRIYEEIGFFGITEDDFARSLDDITADDIEVQISSPGGDVFAGIAIYNALRAHPARVTTRVDGLAASAASIIAQAGDHRQIMSSGQIMIHQAWGLVIGNAVEMRDFADLLEKQDGVLAGIYAERSGGDKDRFLELMAAETYLTDEEAIDAGLADEIVTPPRRDKEPESNRLSDVVAEAEQVISRVQQLVALRRSKGKSLESWQNRESVDALVAAAEGLRNDLEPVNHRAERATELRHLERLAL